MIRNLQRFIRNDSGNILMATALALPVLGWTVGIAVDIGTKEKYQNMVQRAADSAVIAAFAPGKNSWKKRQAYAHSFFRRNLTRADSLGNIKTKLKGRRDKNQLILTYTVTSEVKSLIFARVALQDTRISATSTAVYDMYTGKAPRLVPNKSSSGQNPLSVTQ